MPRNAPEEKKTEQWSNASAKVCAFFFYDTIY